MGMRLSYPQCAALAAMLALAGPAVRPEAPESKAPPHTITHPDVWLMTRLSAPAVSPDGRWVLMTVVEPAYDPKQQATDFWLKSLTDDSPARPLTTSKRPKAGAVWSPDGSRIAFTMKDEKGEDSQIYVLKVGEGTVTQVTHLALGAHNPKWSPDGRSLLFLSRVFPGAVSEEDNRRQEKEHKERRYSALVYDTFPPRFWNHWLDERQVHPFVLELSPGAFPRDLLAGTSLAASPGFSGGFDPEERKLEATWTPEGDGVVFAATTRGNHAESERVALHLYLEKLSGGEPIQLTADRASYSSMSFTRDGHTLVCAFNMESPGELYDASRVVAFSWPGLALRRVLTQDLDRSVSNVTVNPGNHRVYFTYEDAGLERLHSVGLDQGDLRDEPCPASGVCTQLAACGEGVVGLWDSSVNPPEVYQFGPKAFRRLTAFNTARAAAIDLQPPEHFWFTAADGLRIHNMLVRPPAFDPAKKYPLFVVIHGGPASMWRDTFFLRWNYHLLASPGYVVLLADYKGSTGYGEAFARSIKLDPLKGPADEVNQAADYAIAHYGFIDPARQVAGGASYGGHLSNWIQATSTRYRAIVSHAGEMDLIMQWGTSDGNYDRELSSGGPPWSSSPIWRDQSPVLQAGNHDKGTGFLTPILITVGEKDYRVPMNNALMNFAVQQRLGVPSRLIVFPEAGHHIVRGEDSQFWYGEVFSWLARWLK
jgi:dipeptidyl aminopeptidase/acylaminoacyl peptidase